MKLHPERSHPSVKKYLLSVIFVLCAAALVFAACSNHAAPDEAEPAAAPAATATPEPSPEPTPEPDELAENQESNGQGEGEDLGNEMENPAEGESETPKDGETESGQWQVGDTITGVNGGQIEIVDFDKETQEFLENLTPEEIQELRDMQITFN